MMIKSCAFLLPLVVSSGAFAAIIPVVEYKMLDGAFNGLYNDNGYTGTGQGGYLTGGTGQLTDGITGGIFSAGDAFTWYPFVLWQGNIGQIFDLGAVHTLESIQAEFLIYTPAAVYLPTEATLSFSDDGITFSNPQTRTFTALEQFPYAGAVNATVQYEMLTPLASGRYVSISYQRGGEWFAMGEVTFGGPVPEPASIGLLGIGAIALVRRRRIK